MRDVFGDGSLVEFYDIKPGLMFSRQMLNGRAWWTAWEVTDGGNRVIGDMMAHATLDAAIASVKGARISASLRARHQRRYGVIPRTWGGDARLVAKALIDAGIEVVRCSSSTQSRSKYITTAFGTKIRLADHRLPPHYDAPDVEFFYGSDVQSVVQAVKDRESA